MSDWSDEQRESVAAQFRKVGGGWHRAMDLMDACGPLWFECLRCHRLRTIGEVADAAPGRDGAATWRCRRCGFEADGRDVWEYQTAFLLNLTESPHCPPIVREVLTRCGHVLHRVSRGDRGAVAEAGDAARHAVRVLDHYADYQDWFHMPPCNLRPRTPCGCGPGADTGVGGDASSRAALLGAGRRGGPA